MKRIFCGFIDLKLLLGLTLSFAITPLMFQLWLSLTTLSSSIITRFLKQSEVSLMYAIMHKDILPGTLDSSDSGISILTQDQLYLYSLDQQRLKRQQTSTQVLTDFLMVDQLKQTNSNCIYLAPFDFNTFNVCQPTVNEH